VSQPLPEAPNLEWLRKTAKQKLRMLREQNPAAQLADAQFALAREYGFESWRQLKQHVDQTRQDIRKEVAPQEPTRDEIVGAFLQLVGTGAIDRVRAVLAAEPAIVNAVGPHPFWGGRPQALHVAIEAKRRDMFDLLLSAGADVNGDNSEYDFWSPVMLSINRDVPEMTHELIARGAHVGLSEALLFADDDAVERILRGASALPADVPNRGSFLSFARTPFAIDRLIDIGASVDAKDRWGTTPIEAMSRLGPDGQALVQHLLARGMHALPQEYARLGDRQTLEAIINADPGVVQSDAVFMGAVDFGHHALVAWLLERGANVHARASAPSRHTALHSASWNGDLRMVQLLIESGADSAAIDDEHHNTPLGWAEVAIAVTNNPACNEVVEYLRAIIGRAGSQ
jgi:ankyrin repeat protein